MDNKKAALMGAGAILIAGGAYLLSQKPAGAEPELGEGIVYSNLRGPVGIAPVGSVKGVWVDITNNNSEEVTETAIMTGGFTGEDTVTIGAGETETAAFQIICDTAGEFTVHVGGLSLTIIVGQIEVEVTNMVAAPMVVQYGSDVTITVTVQNRNWYESMSYTVEITGAINSAEYVELAPHEVTDVIFVERVNWEGYQTVYCEDFSVLIKGEKVYGPDEPIPPGSYICPICQWQGNSDAEVGRHAAEVHYGYTYPAGTLNADSFDGMGGQLVLYDIIDPNPRAFAKAQWAMGNICSGERLYQNLSGDEKWSIYTYLIDVLGWDQGYVHSYVFTSEFWTRYELVSEFAPGWAEWLPGEPEPGQVLVHEFGAWPADEPLSAARIAEGWEIFDPTPYQAESGVWYITIHRWVYMYI